MINIRKITAQTAHRAEQDGTWGGAPLFTRTLCGLTIQVGQWQEIPDRMMNGVGWERVVGHGPGFLLQPCTRCERAARRVEATVQYPSGVCDDHEYGSEWPCLACGK